MPKIVLSLPVTVTWTCMPAFTFVTSLAATVASTTYALEETTLKAALVLVEDEHVPPEPEDDELRLLDDEPVEPPPLTTSPTERLTASTVPAIVDLNVAWSTASLAFAYDASAEATLLRSRAS